MNKDELEYFKQFTDPIDCKNRIHNYALRKHIEMGQHSSLFMSPGSGKTRIGVIAVGENIKKYGGKGLISVPKENLIKQWKEEFVKWKYGKELKDVDFICHASNSKYDPNDYTIVIIDETHLAISGDVHGSLLQWSYDTTKLLCLTGTKPSDKDALEKLVSIAPCSFELTLDEAVELKLVSEYQINVIDIELTPEELKQYKKVEQSFTYYKSILGNQDAFENAGNILKGVKLQNVTEIFEDKEIIVQKLLPFKYGRIELTNARMLYTAIRSRKAVAQNASNKLIVGKELIDLFPEDNIITFAETNEFTTKLHKSLGERSLIFHSGLKDKQKEEALKKFKDKRTKTNVICSTRALSEGYNVESINTALILAFTSKGHTLIQRLARSIRYIEGKQAKIFILCVPNTQEEIWLKNALKSIASVRYFESINAYKQLL